jgi:hypothetical protein
VPQQTRTRNHHSPLSVVAGHELGGPHGLAGLPWFELPHEGLDVEDRRAVDGVEPADMQVEPIDGDQGAVAHPKAVRSHFGPLGEHADQGPIGVPAWVAGARDDAGLVHQMEEEHDAEVREGIQAGHGVVGEALPVETDDGVDRTPVVVESVTAPAHDHTDRIKGDHGAAR